MKFQSLREIAKITEWKAGCIYRTKKVGYCWITLDKETIPNNDGSLMLISLPAQISMKLGTKTMRKVQDDAPDFEITTLTELGIS